jgi:opacity protein-like surface antigen
MRVVTEEPNVSVEKQMSGLRSIIGRGLAIGLALFAADARADGQLSMPSLYAGYAYQRATLFSVGNLRPVPIWFGQPGELRGWDASVEGQITESFGLRLNLSQRRAAVTTDYGCEALPGPCTATQDKVTNTQRTVLLGPTLSLKDGPLRLFAHALVGLASIDARASDARGQTYKAFGVQPGAGVEIALARPVALRVEADLLHAGYRGPSEIGSGASENNAVLSTGLVVRFGAR